MLLLIFVLDVSAEDFTNMFCNLFHNTVDLNLLYLALNFGLFWTNLAGQHVCAVISKQIAGFASLFASANTAAIGWSIIKAF